MMSVLLSRLHLAFQDEVLALCWVAILIATGILEAHLSTLAHAIHLAGVISIREAVVRFIKNFLANRSLGSLRKLHKHSNYKTWDILPESKRLKSTTFLVHQ